MFLLMLDVRKAFDAVEKAELFRDLLHLLMIILKDVQLQVRVRQEVGRKIKTNIGVPQGGSPSLILFTLYLAQALKPPTSPKKTTIEEHNYSTIPKSPEELGAKQPHGLYIRHTNRERTQYRLTIRRRH